MIRLTPSAPRRAVIACELCAQPIVQAADAVVVPWATSTALVAHKGRCLDGLRLQYPSTAGEPTVELLTVLDDLAELRATAAEAAP